MINSVRGGRSKRAPYNSSTVSVPTAIIPIVKRICNIYRNLATDTNLDFAKMQILKLTSAIEKIEQDQTDTPLTIFEQELQEIMNAIERGDTGYKKNSASQLISRMKILITLR